jgi:HlyD family secretion protein
VRLADFSQWQVETDDLTELNVVRVREGAAVQLAFDALPGVTLPGTVVQIKPIGVNKQGDITYTVVIAPDRWDERLRWNMTAVATIEAER